MQDEVAERGRHYNAKRIRRLLRLMGYEAIYPKRNLSRLGKAKYIHPYLLRGLDIVRPNQVWAIHLYSDAQGLYVAINTAAMFGWQIGSRKPDRSFTNGDLIISDQGSQLIWKRVVVLHFLQQDD
jgi:hypothetical protein